MSTELLVALVSAVSIICSSLLTVLVTVWATKRSRKDHALKVSLLQAYRDIQAFYALEQAYCDNVANARKLTPDAVKRYTRKRLRAEGTPSPSEATTPSRLEQALSRLLQETKE
jgi:hypothetical protein